MKLLLRLARFPACAPSRCRPHHWRSASFGEAYAPVARVASFFLAPFGGCVAVDARPLGFDHVLEHSRNGTSPTLRQCLCAPFKFAPNREIQPLFDTHKTRRLRMEKAQFKHESKDKNFPLDSA